MDLSLYISIELWRYGSYGVVLVGVGGCA